MVHRTHRSPQQRPVSGHHRWLGERSDLDFFNGTPDDLPSGSITTEGPVNHLSVGDIDGDLVNDVVFSQRITVAGEDRQYLVLVRQERRRTRIASAERKSSRCLQIMNAQFSGLDSAIETGIVSQSEDGDSNSIAVLFGSGDRQPLASFGLLASAPTGSTFSSVTGDPVAMTVGQFTNDTHPDIATLAFDISSGTNDLANASLRFWVVPSDHTAELVSGALSDAIPTGLGVLPQAGDTEQGSISATLRVGRPRG